MASAELAPVAHKIAEPVDGIVYSFYSDGQRVEVNGRSQMYYSRAPREGRDIGYLPWTDAEWGEFRQVVISAGVDRLFDALVQINTAV